MFFEITKGSQPAPGNWLTYVNVPKTAPADNNGFAATPVRRDDSDTANLSFKLHPAISHGLHG